jgi:hypothetical protein
VLFGFQILGLLVVKKTNSSLYLAFMKFVSVPAEIPFFLLYQIQRPVAIF